LHACLWLTFDELRLSFKLQQGIPGIYPGHLGHLDHHKSAKEELLMTEGNPPPRPASYDKKVGLVLQGGGALGSYQAGVYEALESSGYTPDWVAGISIGAINAAIIAGNAPKDRMHRLRSFWQEITAPTMLWPQATGVLAACQRWTSAVMAIAFGQPGFFSPYPQSWSDKRVSYYTTSALKTTLDRLVDFDRINAGKEIRLSVGAVNIATGDFAYFDSREITIGPEHVMAMTLCGGRRKGDR
jgi:NTE family protein